MLYSPVQETGGVCCFSAVFELGIREETLMNRLPWTKEELWQGCRLASIVHATMTAHYPDFSHEQSWDGMNYNMQDSQGARGTITFSSDYCVAAFRDDSSECLNDSKEALDFFNGAPQAVIELAQEETLQYLLYDIDGSMQPSITAAFWSDGNALYSNDDVEELLENGAFLLKKQLLNTEDALEAWQEDLEMSEEQRSLVESIYERMVKDSQQNIFLTKQEISMIDSDDPEGLHESETSFQELGIRWGK